MTTKISNFAKKATALFSAIAASSFMGLPALAQTNSTSGSTSSTDCVPTTQSYSAPGSMSSSMSGSQDATTQSSYNYDRSGLNVPGNANPSVMSSGSMSSSGVVSGNPSAPDVSGRVDASAPGRDFPNQTDPRASAPGRFDTVQPSSANSGMSSMNSSASMSTMGTEVPVAYAQEPARMDQTRSASPVDRAAAVVYGDVLSTGGSTTGGESRLRVQAASGQSDSADSERFAQANTYRQSSYQSSMPASSSSMMSGSSMSGSSMSSSTVNDATTPSNQATAGGEASQIVDQSSSMSNRTYTSDRSQTQAVPCVPNTQRNINYDQRNNSVDQPAGTQSPSAPERTNFQGQPAPERDMMNGTSGQERSINYEQRNTGADSLEQRDMNTPSMQAPAGTQSPSAPERTNFQGQPTPERQ